MTDDSLDRHNRFSTEVFAECPKRPRTHSYHDCATKAVIYWLAAVTFDELLEFPG
jgi:hypothetical protein